MITYKCNFTTEKYKHKYSFLINYIMKQEISKKASLLSFLHNMYRIAAKNSFAQSANQKTCHISVQTDCTDLKREQ